MTEKSDDQIKKQQPIITEHRKTLVETIKEHFPNPTEMILDQIIHMFIQWYNRRILIVSTFILIIIPIYMISIGLIFFHSCPKSFYLPLHMIICGITSLIAAIVLLTISIIWKRTIKLTSNLTSQRIECIRMILSIFEMIFLSICLLGLIVLTIVLLRISDTVQLINQTNDYCHPVLYYSSYILLFLIYSIMSTIMIILFLIFHAYQKTQ